MGHKSGLKAAGAKGKEVPMSRTEVESALIDAEDIDIKQLAREHDRAAIGVLGKAVARKGGDKAPWAVSTGAAKTLIEIGHGKSETREGEKKEGGLTVIINQLTSDDQLERVVSGVQIAKEIASAERVDVIDVVDVTPQVVTVTPQDVKFMEEHER